MLDKIKNYKLPISQIGNTQNNAQTRCMLNPTSGGIDRFTSSKESKTIYYPKKDNYSFKIISNDTETSIFTKKNIAIYNTRKNPNNGEITETVYTIDGNKVYDLTVKNNGEKIKTTYKSNGSIFKKILYKSEEIFEVIEDNSEIEDYSNIKEYLPKYLYHFTTEESYNSIIKSGKLKTSIDGKLKNQGNKGIFTVDINNLLDKYCTAKESNEDNYSYLTRLLKYCARDGNKLILLKIPTKKLNLNSLIFRNQKEVLKRLPAKDYSETGKFDLKEYDNLFNLFKENNISCESTMDIVNNIYLPTWIKHVENGENLNKLLDYKNKPLEFIYKEDIDTSLISKAGEIDVSQIEDMPMYSVEAEEIAKELIKSIIK